jgi:hypothetical protein
MRIIITRIKHKLIMVLVIDKIKTVDMRNINLNRIIGQNNMIVNTKLKIKIMFARLIQ